MKNTIMFQYLVAYLCYLFCLLLGSCTAFLEVGVSSYLEENVDHVPETGMTLVKAWDVSSRKGLFLATGAGGNAFHGKFSIPEPGIYFVALNLMIANASDGFLKATLVINNEFEEANGMEGVYGNTTANGILSLSGFLCLYPNDLLALYLLGSKGTLLRASTFSVVHMSRIGSVPGFHAVLSQDVVVQSQAKIRIENWRTSGTKGLFTMHSGASPSVGLFCAILEGIHKFTSNINIQSNDNSTRCLFPIVLNSNITLAQKFTSGGRKYFTSVSGMFYLYHGDCVELQIESKSAGDLGLYSGSFSGLFLGMKSDTDPRFSVSLPTGQVTKSAGWNKVENWTVSSSRRNFQAGNVGLMSSNSTFIPTSEGLFLITVLININGMYSLHRNSIYLLVTVGSDTPTSSNGLLAAKTLLSEPDSLSVSGVVELKKKDSVTVYVQSSDRDGIISDGILSVSLVSYDWPGVSATLKNNITLDMTGWTKLTRWKTNNVPGLFSFDNAFFPTSGVYRTHLDGTYFVSCNVIFMGQAKGSLSVIIAIDDMIDTEGGLFSLEENPKRFATLHVAGSLKLRRNQNISVLVATKEPGSWIIFVETGFSVALVGSESLSTPGIFAGANDVEGDSSSQRIR